MDEFLEKHSSGFLIILVGFIIPILEEIMFRGIPDYVFLGQVPLIIGTVIWTLAHGRRALIIAPMGILFLKLWASGFWIEAIAIHSLHNCFFIGLAIYFYEQDEGDSNAIEHPGVSKEQSVSVPSMKT